MKNLKTVTAVAVIVAMQFVITVPPAGAQKPHIDLTHTAPIADTKPVTWDNWVRAESDKYFKSYAGLGGFGKFFNIRKPTPIDAQKVMRMNRDTLYSFGHWGQLYTLDGSLLFNISSSLQWPGRFESNSRGRSIT